MEAFGDEEHGERFAMQPKEFVQPNQARAYGSITEIVVDFGMHRKDREERDKWLHELWDWAIATDQPMSGLLVESYHYQEVINDEEYAAYSVTKFLKQAGLE